MIEIKQNNSPGLYEPAFSEMRQLFFEGILSYDTYSVVLELRSRNIELEIVKLYYPKNKGKVISLVKK